MYQEIQPPDSLKNIFPDLTLDIELRKKERQRNSSANEVFLQAKGLLESELAQTIKPDIFSGRKLEYRATPPVTFACNGQKASIQVKEIIFLNTTTDHESNFGEIVINLSIGEIDGESLQLFYLRKDVNPHWNPLQMNDDTYSVKNHKGREATIDELEMLRETLTFIGQSLRAV